MVFKLNVFKQQVQNKAAVERAEKRPFDVKAQLALFDTNNNNNNIVIPADYEASGRAKRLQIINKIALPLSTLRNWIAVEMKYIQSKPLASISAVENSEATFGFLEALADLLAGSELSLSIDIFLLQIIGQFESDSLGDQPVTDKDAAPPSPSGTKTVIDVDYNDNETTEVAVVVDDDDEEQQQQQQANNKIISVSGRRLFDAFTNARRRNANHFLENKQIFGIWRSMLEEFHATEDNANELDEAIRASYKLQLLSIPCSGAVLKEVLEEYEGFDLDEDKKFHLLNQVEDKYDIVTTSGNKKKNSSSNKNTASKKKNAFEKFRFLNQLREKSELAMLEAKDAREYCNACKGYAEIERKEKSSSSSNNNDASARPVNKNWLERSLYVLMRGVLGCEQKLSENASDVEQQENQSIRREYAEVGYELLEQMMFTLSTFLAEENQKAGPAGLLNFEQSMMLYPLLKFANWISRHFELFYYYTCLSRNKPDNEDSVDEANNIVVDEADSIWCRRRLRLLESVSIFFLTTTQQQQQGIRSPELARFQEHIQFATSEKQAEQFIASRASLWLVWTVISSKLHNINEEQGTAQRQTLQTCIQAVESDTMSIDDIESAMLLPCLMQVAQTINNNNQSELTMGVKNALALARGYFVEKNLPLQSYMLLWNLLSQNVSSSSSTGTSHHHHDYQLIVVFWNLFKYRKEILVEDVRARHQQQQQQKQQVTDSTNDTNRIRAREGTDGGPKPESSSGAAASSSSSSSSLIKKFYIYKFPKDKKEKEIREALLAEPQAPKPVSVDFIRPKGGRANHSETVTVVLSFNASDIETDAVEKVKLMHCGQEFQVPKFLALGFVRSFPGTNVSGEMTPGTRVTNNNNNTNNNTSTSHSSSNNADGKAAQQMTNDDFAKLLG